MMWQYYYMVFCNWLSWFIFYSLYLLDFGRVQAVSIIALPLIICATYTMALAYNSRLRGMHYASYLCASFVNAMFSLLLLFIIGKANDTGFQLFNFITISGIPIMILIISLIFHLYEELKGAVYQ